MGYWSYSKAFAGRREGRCATFVQSRTCTKCLTARDHDEIAIRELAHQISAATGFEGELMCAASQPNGQPHRRLEVTRARERFGFAAKVRFAEHPRCTVAWFRGALAAGAL